MKITCIADLHGHYPKLTGGDLLIVAGDLTVSDKEYQYRNFYEWLDDQDYDLKIVIAGNHDDYCYECYKNQCVPFGMKNVQYLCDSACEFEGLKIWGCPWTPRFIGINPKCTAFTYDSEIWFYDEKVMKIPHDIDILITHGPAYGILDGIPIEDGTLFHSGSSAFEGWLKYVSRPRLHIFGHIHEAYGIQEIFPTYNDKMMQSINCSYVNEKYKPVNKPVDIEI